MEEPLALYVHWPFCKSKCPYCDFNSHVREGVDQARWKRALLAELAHMKKELPGRTLSSIFFGGGTPSLMPPDTVAAVIEAATSHWRAEHGIEITLEANPTSAEAASFEGFRAAGVNRVSLGVQSLREADLRFLGRAHSAGEALEAVALAARIFPRFSFDLIYARPGQGLADWEKELKEALTHAGSHLSLYQLTIEENTAFYHAYHHKRAFDLPEDSLAAELYTLTQDIMEDAGLPAYEISNHARAGEESRHNLAYWLGREYAGIGPGAHGRIGLKSERAATQTLKSPERWLEAVESKGHGLEYVTPLTQAERFEEWLMMRLRLPLPIALHDAPQPLDMSKIEKLAAGGLLTFDGHAFATTLRGRLLLNYVTGELLADS